MLFLTKKETTSDALQTFESGRSLTVGGLAVRGGGSYDWGTMGCCLWINGQPCGLTNYHVLFGEHTPPFVMRHLAGHLEVNLAGEQGGQTIGLASRRFNQALDYALFDITETLTVETVTELDKTIVPQIGMEVWKKGGATGLTFGIIDDMDGSHVFIRRNTVKTQDKLCDGGDSGSLWVYDDGSSHPRPVALHQGRDIHAAGRGRACAFYLIEAAIHAHQ